MKKESFEDAIPKPSNIYFKLWKAKQQIGKVAKNSKNPHFKNNYADINALTAEVEPILLEYGLLMLQPIVDGYVSTVVMDAESGESVSSSMRLPEINDPQKIGSAITYYRRYTLQSLLCLQTEDDDAQSASTHIKTQRPKMPQERFEAGLLKIEQGKLTVEVFKKAIEGYELTDVQTTALSLL
jgi:hypothetical protein